MNAPKNIIFETPWFSVSEIPDIKDGSLPYYIINCPDSVAILAMTEDSEFILVRQFRLSLNDYTLELPSGYVDKDENHSDAIRRELLEETGYECKDLFYLNSLKIFPSRMNYSLHCYFGRGAVQKSLILEKDIEVFRVSINKFENMIMNDIFNQPSGLAIYFKAKNSGFWI